MWTLAEGDAVVDGKHGRVEFIDASRVCRQRVVEDRWAQGQFAALIFGLLLFLLQPFFLALRYMNHEAFGAVLLPAEVTSVRPRLGSGVFRGRRGFGYNAGRASTHGGGLPGFALGVGPAWGFGSAHGLVLCKGLFVEGATAVLALVQAHLLVVVKHAGIELCKRSVCDAL